MKTLQPVIWSKGTILTPQHLQLQDRYLEDLLHFNLNALRCCPWGFKELQVDQGTLVSGNFAVARASGILPDGIIFEIPESDEVPAQCSLIQSFGAGAETVDLYLAIPCYLERGVNVGGVDTRYTATVLNVKDDNNARLERPVRVARKNFRLLLGEEMHEGFCGLRVGRVKRDSAGTFQLDPSVVPPLLDISSNNYLMTILRGLVGFLLSQNRELSQKRGERGPRPTAFTTSEIVEFWLHYTANSYYPLLRHILQTKKGHPDQLFAIMSSLAGALTAFSPVHNPNDLPRYDHNELGACFSALDRKIQELFRVPGPHVLRSFPFKLIRYCIYATEALHEEYFPKSKIYLAVSVETMPGESAESISRLIVVDWESQIDERIRASMSSRFSLTPENPVAIPLRPNTRYFGVNLLGNGSKIPRIERLAAYVPDRFPNPRLELFIQMPQAD